MFWLSTTSSAIGFSLRGVEPDAEFHFFAGLGRLGLLIELQVFLTVVKTGSSELVEDACAADLSLLSLKIDVVKCSLSVALKLSIQLHTE